MIFPRLLILATGIPLFLTVPNVAYSGIKVGAFIPTNSDFSVPAAFTAGIDAHLNLKKRFRIGAEMVYVHNITGDEYKYSTDIFYGDEIESDLMIMNFSLVGKYYFTDNLYLGVGAGYFCRVSRYLRQASHVS